MYGDVVCGITCPITSVRVSSLLRPRALPATNLGIDSQRNGYYVYVPELNRITTAYHLSFQERKFLQFNEDGIASLPRGIKPLQDTSLYRKSNVPNLPPGNVNDDESDGDDVNVNNDIQPEKCDHPKCTLPKHNDSIPHSYEDYPSRDKGRNVPRARPTRSYDFNVTGETFHVIIDNVNGEVLEVAPEAILSDTSTPSTYKEAINSPNSRRWIESMSKEITDLKKNETWEYVRRRDVPKTHRVTKSKWVYKIKLNNASTVSAVGLGRSNRSFYG